MAGLGPAARRPCLPCAVAPSPRLTAPSGCPDPGAQARPVRLFPGAAVAWTMICTRNGMTFSSTEPKTSTCVIGNTARHPVPVASGTAGSTTAPAAQVVPLVQAHDQSTGPRAVGPADWDHADWHVLGRELDQIAAWSPAEDLRRRRRHPPGGDGRPRNCAYVISGRGEVIGRSRRAMPPGPRRR